MSGTANAFPEGEVDLDASTFDLRGGASGGIYVQGSSTVAADSVARLRFGMSEPGRVTFDLVNLIVDDQSGRTFSFDRPGEARAFLRIVDLDRGRVVFEQQLDLDDQGSFEEVLDEDSQSVPLRPGSYRLAVGARIDDETQGLEEIVGSWAVAEYHVRGRIDS